MAVLLSSRSITRSVVLLSVSSFGPSCPIARPLLRPRLTSGDASEDLSIPVANDQHVARSPRVLRTLCHASARRIYGMAFRTRIGLHRFWPAHPATSPHPLPVRRASALPPASFRRPVARAALAVQLTVPHVGPVEDFHLQESAPCRAHQRKRGGSCLPPLRLPGPRESTQNLYVRRAP